MALTTHVEATVFGTALLAGFGSGVYGDLRHTARELVSVREVRRPARAPAHIYRENFKAFKDTYECLRPGFEKLYSQANWKKSVSHGRLTDYSR